MIVDDIGVVIVTYFPDVNSLKKNISSLKKVIKNILVVDNATNNCDLKLELQELNIKTIFNAKNKGIAAAQNQGCQFYYNNNYKRVLLLDQDSYFDAETIYYLKETINEVDCAIAGPQILISLKDNMIPTNFLIDRGIFTLKKTNIPFGKQAKVLINISSGSLLDLDIWMWVGGFREELFIDGVDDEYCLRIKQYGYYTKINTKSSLVQKYGNLSAVKQYGFAFAPTFHSPLRDYYSYRNKILIIKEYIKTEKYYVFFQLLSMLKKYITILMFEDKKLEKTKAIIIGIWHGIKNVSGEAIMKF